MLCRPVKTKITYVFYSNNIQILVLEYLCWYMLGSIFVTILLVSSSIDLHMTA